MKDTIDCMSNADKYDYFINIVNEILNLYNRNDQLSMKDRYVKFSNIHYVRTT